MNEQTDSERDVQWETIGVQVREDLDLIVDFLTETELFIMNYLLDNGPTSKRQIWNKRCRDILKNRYREGPDTTNKFRDEMKERRTEKTQTEFYDWIREKLQEFDIDYPSYHTIEKTLHDLEEYGLVRRRNVEGRNYNELWLVNPSFKKAWRRRRREILTELTDEESKARADQLYEPKVLDFFNIHLGHFFSTQRKEERRS